MSGVKRKAITRKIRKEDANNSFKQKVEQCRAKLQEPFKLPKLVQLGEPDGCGFIKGIGALKSSCDAPQETRKMITSTPHYTKFGKFFNNTGSLPLSPIITNEEDKEKPLLSNKSNNNNNRNDSLLQNDSSSSVQFVKELTVNVESIKSPLKDENHKNVVSKQGKSKASKIPTGIAKVKKKPKTNDNTSNQFRSEQPNVRCPERISLMFDEVDANKTSRSSRNRHDLMDENGGKNTTLAKKSTPKMDASKRDANVTLRKSQFHLSEVEKTFTLDDVVHTSENRFADVEVQTSPFEIQAKIDLVPKEGGNKEDVDPVSSRANDQNLMDNSQSNASLNNNDDENEQNPLQYVLEEISQRKLIKDLTNRKIDQEIQTSLIRPKPSSANLLGRSRGLLSAFKLLSNNSLIAKKNPCPLAAANQSNQNECSSHAQEEDPEACPHLSKKLIDKKIEKWNGIVDYLQEYSEQFTKTNGVAECCADEFCDDDCLCRSHGSRANESKRKKRLSLKKKNDLAGSKGSSRSFARKLKTRPTMSNKEVQTFLNSSRKRISKGNVRFRRSQVKNKNSSGDNTNNESKTPNIFDTLKEGNLLDDLSFSDSDHVNLSDDGEKPWRFTQVMSANSENQLLTNDYNAGSLDSCDTDRESDVNDESEIRNVGNLDGSNATPNKSKKKANGKIKSYMKSTGRRLKNVSKKPQVRSVGKENAIPSDDNLSDRQQLANETSPNNQFSDRNDISGIERLSNNVSLSMLEADLGQSKKTNSRNKENPAPVTVSPNKNIGAGDISNNKTKLKRAARRPNKGLVSGNKTLNEKENAILSDKVQDNDDNFSDQTLTNEHRTVDRVSPKNLFSDRNYISGNEVTLTNNVSISALEADLGRSKKTNSRNKENPAPVAVSPNKNITEVGARDISSNKTKVKRAARGPNKKNKTLNVEKENAMPSEVQNNDNLTNKKNLFSDINDISENERLANKVSLAVPETDSRQSRRTKKSTRNREKLAQIAVSPNENITEIELSEISNNKTKVKTLKSSVSGNRTMSRRDIDTSNILQAPNGGRPQRLRKQVQLVVLPENLASEGYVLEFDFKKPKNRAPAIKRRKVTSKNENLDVPQNVDNGQKDTNQQSDKENINDSKKGRRKREPEPFQEPSQAQCNSPNRDRSFADVCPLPEDTNMNENLDVPQNDDNSQKDSNQQPDEENINTKQSKTGSKKSGRKKEPVPFQELSRARSRSRSNRDRNFADVCPLPEDTNVNENLDVPQNEDNSKKDSNQQQGEENKKKSEKQAKTGSKRGRRKREPEPFQEPSQAQCNSSNHNRSFADVCPLPEVTHDIEQDSTVNSNLPPENPDPMPDEELMPPPKVRLLNSQNTHKNAGKKSKTRSKATKRVSTRSYSTRSRTLLEKESGEGTFMAEVSNATFNNSVEPTSSAPGNLPEIESSFRCIVEGKEYNVTYVKYPSQAQYEKIDNLYLSRCLETLDSNITSGFLRFPPGEVKPFSEGQAFTTAYFVASGSCDVLIEAQETVATVGSYFIIPVGVKYKLANRSGRDELVLGFLKLKT